jgi:bifunctional N-acetylglucosamine-1-phosphate-uridyltransferase/glucosamine-1-phosphate-acetyltransferase GlmU-like protein
VVIVDDAPTGARLCGRGALDWLLDTVAALHPEALVVRGTADQAREQIAAHAALAGLRAGYPHERSSRLLVLRSAVPLVRPATLRRAVRRLTEGAADVPRAVVVRAAAEPPWWAEPATPETTGIAAVALTDPAVLAGVPGMPDQPVLEAAGLHVYADQARPPESLRLNLAVERVQAENAVYRWIAEVWLSHGVLIDDPTTTRIDPGVRIGPGVRIRSHTELIGDSVIGSGSEIGPATTIRDSLIGEECLVRYSICQHVRVGARSNIGPYCWLRSGTRLGARSRAGAFVEIADSVVGDDTSVPHLGGLVSADVGHGCNIAGLSGPANFDGVRKHRIQIGDGVSIGAGNILVAPLRIGDGAHTAAGSVITKDVPGGALAAARAEQRNYPGWTAERSINEQAVR